jgi:hypothetical protein
MHLILVRSLLGLKNDASWGLQRRFSPVKEVGTTIVEVIRGVNRDSAQELHQCSTGEPNHPQIL